MNSRSGVIFKSGTQKGKFKILLGTPIHESLDFSAEKWFKNLSELQKVTPTDIFLVDSSPGKDYVNKIRAYCKKYGLDPKIFHFEIIQGQPMEEKVSRSREIIRQYALNGGYDAWFSWESDLLLPADSLKIMTQIMESGNYTMVQPNTWSREAPTQPETGFAACLIKTSALKNNGFLIEYPGMSGSTLENETLFKKKVIEEGGNSIEVFGLIKPIIRLNE